MSDYVPRIGDLVGLADKSVLGRSVARMHGLTREDVGVVTHYHGDWPSARWFRTGADVKVPAEFLEFRGRSDT